jgi:hypothetical protein
VIDLPSGEGVTFGRLVTRRFVTLCVYQNEREDNKVVSNQDPSSTSNELRKRHSDQKMRPVSDRAMAIFFAFLVAFVVLGYLAMTKLADDSRAENCMMEHCKIATQSNGPSK